MIAPRYKRRIGLLIPAIAAAIGIGTWLTNWTLDHKRKQRFEANLVRITELLALPKELAPAAKFDAVRVFVHRHSRHGRDSSAFRKLIGRNELITEALISHATDQNSEPLQAECSIRSNLMAAVLRKLGFKTRIVYLFDTDGKDGDKLRSHTFVDVLNPAMEEWESHDPDYNFYWQSKITSKRISVAEEAEAVSSIEPCSEIRCGWDLVSDEGRPASALLGLTDIVSTVDKLTDERISRVTSRANLNKTFTFYGRTGPFCEVMKRLCVRIEPAAPARRG